MSASVGRPVLYARVPPLVKHAVDLLAERSGLPQATVASYLLAKALGLPTPIELDVRGLLDRAR